MQSMTMRCLETRAKTLETIADDADWERDHTRASAIRRIARDMRARAAAGERSEPTF
jgi:hypothetical protein